jgi:alpha-L-fucosidase
LPKGKTLWFGEIKEIKMLGSNESLKWVQTENGLTVQLPATVPCQYAFTLKISGK